MVDKLLLERYGSAGPDIDPDALNPTISGILSRRSHRAFTPDPVDERLLTTLLATAFSAPSKSDLQQACAIVVDDPATRQRIAGSRPYLQWIARAPVFIVWCGDHRRIRQVSESRGHRFANDHLDAFFNAAVDTGIAMQTFLLAAESLGLGCCPVSQIRDEVDLVSELLALPELVFPVAGMCLGWPAEKPAVSMRLPLEVTVHRNRYSQADTAERLDSYSAEREQRSPTPDDRQRGTARFGTSDDYGWCEDKARQYAEPMRTEFGRYVRQQGFRLD